MFYFRFSLATREVEEFVDDVTDCFFYEEGFYFRKHRYPSIYRKDLVTGQEEVVRGEGLFIRDIPYNDEGQRVIISFVSLVDGHLYYTMSTPAGVYRLEDDGNDVLISNFEITSDQVLDYAYVTSSLHKLYYCNSPSSDFTLLEYDPETGETTEFRLTTGRDGRYGLKIVDGYVFYRTRDDLNRIEYTKLFP
ncbi:MAG: hypothetical protein FWD45_01470 [Coriobacteriia bacterium]|nr:hypothetical protein [Coriobacteriia bacterium]